MADSKAGLSRTGHKHQADQDEMLRKQARLIDLTPSATIVRDLEGTIMFWSKGAESLYGWTKEEALGRLTHDLLRTEFPEPIENIVANLKYGGKWTGELRQRTNDGHTVTVESHWLAGLDSQGGVLELMESNTDITERKRLQEDLEEVVQKRTARLRESNAQLEAFSYSLSHDMRAPLRTILSFTDIVLEDCGAELSSTAKDYLGRVSAAARRLDRLIHEVLALSRVSREPMQMRPVDLHELAAHIIQERAELQEPRAEVRIEGRLPAVQGHEALLTQIVTNLLENAVKFVEPGVKPNVRIRSESIDDKVRLWVEDNGIGIAVDARAKIFELFGRNERVLRYEGNGIGLAIVRKAAERMRGTVGVNSEVGRGSRFWVELRRVASTTGASPG